MYIRSSSEPPDQNEDQLKNGLRGGFPIKINGYALGSQENLQDLGRETSAERSCIFGPRVRSRQNSVSRQSSVTRNLDPEPEGGGGGALYTSTPFGPLQGKVSGSKLGHHNTNRVSSCLSSHNNYSSSTVSVAKTDPHQSSSLLNLSLIGSQDESVTLETARQPLSEEKHEDVGDTEVPREREVPQNNFIGIIKTSSSSSTNQIYEPPAQSQPPSRPAPFMFQRPKEFHKKTGSFGSQINLSSRNGSSERSLRDVSCHEKNSEYSSQPYNKSSKESGLENQEISSDGASHQHNDSYSKTETHTILQECSDINKLSTETRQIASEISEKTSFVCEMTQSSGNTINWSESETQDGSPAERDHYNAQCRYETSHTETEETETLSQDIKEFNIEAKIVIRPAECEIQNTASGFIDEAQTPRQEEFRNEVKSISESEEMEQEYMNESDSISVIQETSRVQQKYSYHNRHISFGEEIQQINYEYTNEMINDDDPQTEDTETDYIAEVKLKEGVEEDVDHKSIDEIKNIKEDEEDLFINSQQKDIIKSCIEELEKLAEFDTEYVPRETEIDKYISAQAQRQSQEVTNRESEEVEFTTEEIIDSEDLEHIHVASVKSEQRRLSTQINNTIKVEDIEVIEKEETPSPTNENDEVDEQIEGEEVDDQNEGDEVNQNIEVEKMEKSGFEQTQTFERRESFFLTETCEEERVGSKMQSKRERNRTIDYHNLPSLYWEASVQNYHEKQYVETEEKAELQAEEDKGGIDLAKDGLSLILQKLQEIESKLDNLPKPRKKSQTRESTSVGVPQTPEPRRLSLPGRFSSLTDLSGEGGVPSFLDEINNKREEAQVRLEIESLGPTSGTSSNCSTPTLMEMKNIKKEGGYESDSTILQDSDCEGIIDEKSENDERESYKAFNMNIMEISDLESSDEEDLEERSRRIEQMAAAMNLMNNESSTRRAELNMDIDTLSERSEDESEKERPPVQRSRRPSGRKRSMSRERRERSVAKIRYCWRCHKAGHENWECREEVQPGGWCPRCLETSHWEDECWVEASAVVCPICNLPGHLPCIHQATDFRQRKLVIDTFGWLPFKEWFQDLTFRSWWNCSGYTGVPLYKILQRNPDQDLDLGFAEPGEH